MNYKKSIILVLVFLFIMLLYLPLYQCFAEKIERDAVKFVEKIYVNYAEQNFSNIYDRIHLGIKDILSEREYIIFNEENFKKYSLKITDIKVENNIKRVTIPEEFQEYIEGKENNGILELYVTYHMSFLYGGKRMERDVGKKVYIFRGQEQDYLLWDPRIVK